MAARHHVLDIYGPTSMGLATFACWEPKGAGKAVPHLVLWIDVANHADDHLELVDTCAHEATRGASNILDWIGHHKAGDEPHAYLIGWLTRWMYEQCHELASR